MTRAAGTIPHALLAACCLLAAWLGLGAPRADAAPSGGRAVQLPRGAIPGDGGPSRAIFPPQSLPLRFNHKKHVQELGVSCDRCHALARTSTSSRDRLLPHATRCDACHGSDHRNLNAVVNAGKRPSGECGHCHVGASVRDGVPWVAPVVLPAPNLKFDHRAHAVRNIPCQRCHGAVENVELATREQLPRMRGCLDCHRAREGESGAATVQENTSSGARAAELASGACSTCHLTEGGRLMTNFPSGELLPPRWMHDAEHGPDWIERHRSVAGADSRFCSSCHSEKDCADCHDGRVRPRRIHPNDFLSMHPIAARQNSASCTSCHRQQSFCLSCHQRTGVAASGPFGNFTTRGRFHPPKAVWTDGPRSSRHHAWEAQRNLNTCTSCHSERDCATCHSTRRVGGPGGDLSLGARRGVDPHPPGFKNRCARPLRQNPRSCIFCHGRDDPRLLGCR
jgi:hypothetical protein